MPKSRKTKKSKTLIRNKYVPQRNTRNLFDLMFKYILQESSQQAKIHFVNGLFGKNFPLDTKVTFPITESTSIQGKKLEHIQSDFIMLVSEESFIIEVQIRDDSTIALRIFEYSFAYSKRHNTTINDDGALVTMRLPERIVLHLESTIHTKDKVTFRVEQSNGTYFDYETPVYKVIERDVAEFEQKDLQLLLPFYLVKYRQEVNRSIDNSLRRREIAEEVEHIILLFEKMLERGCEAGKLTGKDSIMIMERVVQMYNELYGSFKEFREERMRLERRLRTQWQDYWERGIQEGVQKGIQEGIQRGIQHGKQEERAKILGLLRQGCSLEEVERLLAGE